MAKPTDDCFTPGSELMPLEEALALLANTLEPATGIETVALIEGLNRTLAETVISDRDVPPHNNSAVDGYAFFFDDVLPDGETRLPVTGRIAAGHPLNRPAKRGEALRIFTGAPVPDGSDTIIMQEDVRVEGDEVVFGPGIKRGANLRLRGEDIEAGDAVLQSGTLLRPQELGLAASVGRAQLAVRKRLRVAIFSTGDEVRDPGGDAPAGCIFDANRYTIGALLQDLGCRVTDLGILPDNFETIRDALDEASGAHDMLITSGGVSVGDEDHVKAAIDALGSIHFWRLAIKPGRPIALGKAGKAAFIGLPGNPVAAMTTFMRIARPVILWLSGRNDVAPHIYRVRSAFAFKKKAGRREWLRAHLVKDADGEPRAAKFASDGSGVLMSMVVADGLVELPEDMATLNEGDLVDFLPFSEVVK
ncbi:MAG: molybdopterin molybdotransferase MoeA [Alphaproteobacteria bacterium]|nr:molybdopterin molybdotransferase MoeA [Alphaproteobacteria bacterium]